MDLNHKIKQILVDKNISPSQFADDIGVQRSSISHILAGRNRPSLDIVKKIISTYSDIDIEWLLDIESTNNNADSTTESVSSETIRPAYTAREIVTKVPERVERNAPQPNYTDAYQPHFTRLEKAIAPSKMVTVTPELETNSTPVEPPLQVERILVFYTNGTFKEYKPS